MRHFTFGRNNGLRVSALALGAGTFGTRWGYGATPEDVPRIFDTFADAGGTFIDTAASYQVGEAEENLGRLLDGRRDDFTIATKFAIGGPEGTGVLQTGNGRRAMFRSVEGSLRRLGTDYIDLLWVHFPDFVTPIDEIVRGLDDLASAGKILYAGLSNFPAWMTARAATLAEMRGAIPISGVQLEYSLVERSADRENLPMAESLGLGAALWSPLGGGLLTGNTGRALTEGSPIGTVSCTAKRSRSSARPSTRSSGLPTRSEFPQRKSRWPGLWSGHGSPRPAWCPSSARELSNKPIRISPRSMSDSAMSSTHALTRSAGSAWARRSSSSPRRPLLRLGATPMCWRPRRFRAVDGPT